MGALEVFTVLACFAAHQRFIALLRAPSNTNISTNKSSCRQLSLTAVWRRPKTEQRHRLIFRPQFSIGPLLTRF
jgi:hypothetical protein